MTPAVIHQRAPAPTPEMFAFGIGEISSRIRVSYQGESRWLNGPAGPCMSASEADLIKAWMGDIRGRTEAAASGAAFRWARRSSEDAAEPAIKAHFAEPRIAETQGAKDGVRRHDAVEPLNTNDPVDLALGVANAKHVPGTGVAIELLFEGDEQFLVFGQWRYAVDELRIHGFLPVDDVVRIHFLMKAAAVIKARWNWTQTTVSRFARNIDSRA